MTNQKIFKKFNPGRLFGPGRLLIFDLFSTLDGYLAMDVYSALESILEKLKLQIEHLCVLFKMFLQFPLLRICMITVRALVHLFVCMSWFSMLLQIDFFRKLLVTILACFVTSCPHENN